jgi:hypothetical protein
VEPRAGTERWLTGGVGAIGTASLLSDAGHEITTALLPSLLTSTLGAPAAALGLIEGISDGASGVAKLAGGAIADDPARRGPTAVGGYAVTAVLSSLVGVATNAVQVAFLRAGAWTARGIRGRRGTRSSPTSCPLPRTAAPSGSSARWTTWARSPGRSSRCTSCR